MSKWYYWRLYAVKQCLISLWVCGVYMILIGLMVSEGDTPLLEKIRTSGAAVCFPMMSGVFLVFGGGSLLPNMVDTALKFGATRAHALGGSTRFLTIQSLAYLLGLVGIGAWYGVTCGELVRLLVSGFAGMTMVLGIALFLAARNLKNGPRPGGMYVFLTFVGMVLSIGTFFVTGVASIPSMPRDISKLPWDRYTNLISLCALAAGIVIVMLGYRSFVTRVKMHEARA